MSREKTTLHAVCDNWREIVLFDLMGGKDLPETASDVGGGGSV